MRYVVIYGLFGCTIFSTYLTNITVFEKKFERKMYVRIFSTDLFETFLIIIKIE